MKASVHHVSMPMRSPFGHARATRRTADNVVVTVERDGVPGIGESVPREYVTGETVDSVFAALTSLDLDALERSIDGQSLAAAARSIEALDLPARLAAGGRPGLAASCALELALLDSCGRRFGHPLRALAAQLDLPESLRQRPGQRYPVAGALDFTRTPEELHRECAGLSHLKVKLGLGRDQDVDRVRRVREMFGDSLGLAVDANMAWSLDEAVAMVERLAPYRVAWYEEPLAKGALADYRALRQRTGARVMLDESLCSASDAAAALAAEACDLFNIRLSKCGGFVASLRLAALAHRHGLSFQLGIQIGEMAVLTAAARQFAGAVRGLAAYEGTGVDRRFAEQITNELISIDRDTWMAEDLPGPGLGVTVHDQVLRAHTRRVARFGDGGWAESRAAT
jgi:L-Ala-D/L-Glu epimerase